MSFATGPWLKLIGKCCGARWRDLSLTICRLVDRECVRSFTAFKIFSHSALFSAYATYPPPSAL
jgi:hypothetical protein